MTDERPQRIGRYEVITRLAIGGMAELFLARERGIAGLERVVVLKRILPHLADKPTFVDMFLREARIAARLAHPNVVQIFDLGEEDGSFYIAMEYIHGTTVRELQVLCEKEARRFPIDVSVVVMLQALRGLHAAHELKDLEGKTLGLVHRDVSPHNLMCTTDGHVKLLDFGVAKATEEGIEATYSGNLKGKFAYMSPEQARRKELDRRSDVFGAGVVFWEMLTGGRLFKRESEMEMMEAVLAGDVPRPSTLAPETPAEIEEVVLLALQTERDARYGSAEEMRQALLDAAATAGVGTANESLAGFVSEVAGQHLDLRREVLQNALERSLTQLEKRDLLHVTGSESEVSRDTAIDIPAVAKMTRDVLHASRTDTGEVGSGRSEAPAAATGETVLARPSPELIESEKPGSGRPALVASGVVFVALLLVAGFLAFQLVDRKPAAGDAEPVLLGEPLPWAYAPTVDPVLLREEIEPLRKYLERKTGRPMPTEVTESYNESSRRLLEGEVAFAVLPPLMYVRTEAKNTSVDPIAVKFFDGATHSDGLLLVRGDSEIRSVKDLEGKKFCFTDKNSTTGNFLPRAYIKDQGFDPAKFIGEVHWSGDHIQALRDITDGKCDAAAVYSGAFIAADKLEVPVSRLRTLAITGNVPQEAVIAGPGVSKQDKRAVQKALLEFDPKRDVGRERLGETQRITGFHEIDDASYDFLRKIIAEYQDDSAEPSEP